MQTECSADLLGFARVEGRSVVAAFDGGKITSDAGGVLLGAADRAISSSQRAPLNNLFGGHLSDDRPPNCMN